MIPDSLQKSTEKMDKRSESSPAVFRYRHEMVPGDGGREIQCWWLNLPLANFGCERYSQHFKSMWQRSSTLPDVCSPSRQKLQGMSTVSALHLSKLKWTPYQSATFLFSICFALAVPLAWLEDDGQQMLEISSWREERGNCSLNKIVPRVPQFPKTAHLWTTDIYLSPPICVCVHL